MTVPDMVLKEIRERARKQWPEDKEMQEYSVEEEVEGYLRFQALDFSSITDSERDQIIESAKLMEEGWGQVANEVAEEVEALRVIKEYAPKNVSEDLLFRWKREAEELYGWSYSRQLNSLESRLRQYESAIKTRLEIDPIKSLLIELEEIVGNECYNGNIQNYSSWGELDSEGRSFRYPVKFSSGRGEYKKWKVMSDIPSEDLITGYYAFGANELGIYRALYKILKHLEKNFQFKLPNV